MLANELTFNLLLFFITNICDALLTFLANYQARKELECLLS